MNEGAVVIECADLPGGAMVVRDDRGPVVTYYVRPEAMARLDELEPLLARRPHLAGHFAL